MTERLPGPWHSNRAHRSEVHAASLVRLDPGQEMLDPTEAAGGGESRSSGDGLAARVDTLLSRLLQPQFRGDLERYRFPGSTNRVYRIPLGPGQEFVIVKLLPPKWVDLKVRFRRTLKNLLYGEHEPSLGRRRARAEIARYREWQEAGFDVPRMIPTRFKDVRVFEGLPFPTLYLILNDPGIPLARKRKIVGRVARSLSAQHEFALAAGKKGLVHRDPGPWNVMYDGAANRPYWFDLEHADASPNMTLEALCARAVRVFLNGVLVHLEHDIQGTVEVFVSNYRLENVLRRYVASMERRKRSLVHRALDRMRTNGSAARLLRLGLAEALRAAVLDRSR